MHETMIAESLLTQISEEASKQNAKPLAAKISCGKLNTVNEEVLCFAFDVIAKGTVCENMKLFVEQKPLMAVCRECKNNFAIDFSNVKCPICMNENIEILPDAPLLLEEIEFESE
jgi:hydrogenase nickel incorporation protein HypA/HybF